MPLPGGACDVGGARGVASPDGHDCLSAGGREGGRGSGDVASGVPATAQCRCTDGESAVASGLVPAAGRFSASARIVVQASSAAANDVPAAVVMATGKPAASLAGSLKSVPVSPAARGRAATAIIWPRRESALLTAEAIPAWRALTLASTVAVMGVISAARPAPKTASEGSTPARQLSPG